MFSVHHTEASLEKSEEKKWIDVPHATYVQRDLEDQIREEQEALGLTNINKQVMAITTSNVLNDLKSGFTRFKKDDVGYGSIEEKYGLTVDEVKELFQTPSLKAKKTSLPKRKLEIIDDLAAPQEGVDSNADIVYIPGSDQFVDRNAPQTPVINVISAGTAYENLIMGPNSSEEPQKDSPSETTESKENLFA